MSAPHVVVGTTSWPTPFTLPALTMSRAKSPLKLSHPSATHAFTPTARPLIATADLLSAHLASSMAPSFGLTSWRYWSRSAVTPASSGLEESCVPRSEKEALNPVSVL